jgi:hypothetical protein
MYFTSHAIQNYVGDRLTETQILLIIVLIEHIIIAIKVLIAALIKDVPEWVTKEEQEQDARLTALYNVLDEKKDNYTKKGGILLKDQIKMLKKMQSAAPTEREGEVKKKTPNITLSALQNASK